MGADEVIAFARRQIGKPYVFGAVGPNTYDCSGLVVAAYKAGANKVLPHYTGTLVGLGTAVTKEQLQPGDLVFPDYHHVQIYSGNGMIIEAPRTGLNVREVKMWGFWKGRRLITPGTGVGGGSSGQGGGTTYTPVDNPLVPDSVEKAAAFLGDPAVWRKVAWYGAGSLLVVLGGYLLYQGEAANAVGSVVKAVKS